MYFSQEVPLKSFILNIPHNQDLQSPNSLPMIKSYFENHNVFIGILTLLEHTKYVYLAIPQVHPMSKLAKARERTVRGIMTRKDQAFLTDCQEESSFIYSLSGIYEMLTPQKV